MKSRNNLRNLFSFLLLVKRKVIISPSIMKCVLGVMTPYLMKRESKSEMLRLGGNKQAMSMCVKEIE